MSDPNRDRSAAQFRSLLRSFAFDPGPLTSQLLTAEQLAPASPRRSVRPATGSSRLWSRSATFLGQILSEDHSCQAAVDRLVAWRTARGLPACSRRHRRLLQGPPAAPRDTPAPDGPRHRRPPPGQAPEAWLFHGRRVVVADGSTVSMPDTAENQAEYPQHSLQKPGCGFPIARIVVLIALATGSCARRGDRRRQGEADRRDGPDPLPARAAEAGRHRVGRQLLQLVRRGGDAGGPGRRHGDAPARRPASRLPPRRRLGREDHLVQWQRSRNRPSG